MTLSTVRFSARPPTRYSVGTDFVLWIARVEMYFEEAEVPQEKKARELLALLDDSSFRVVSQLGLLGEARYERLKATLERHFSPVGNELEYQYQLQCRYQKEAESLFEFAGELRALTDRAYPEWVPKQRPEMARNQFVRGISSPSIQFNLMKEQPKTSRLCFGDCTKPPLC